MASTMLKKIISGGQTGADIAGIDAAIANDFPYGGWVPKGRRTEDGPLPDKYQLQEMPTNSYPKRTERNVLDSDGTVIFTHGRLSGGSDLTRKVAAKHGKPWLHLNMREYSVQEAVEKLRIWVNENRIEVLNMAGRSASKDPDIYSVTYRVVGGLLKKGG
jgi:hypothetical protein